MASMFSNVLGYLCPKTGQQQQNGNRARRHAVPDSGLPAAQEQENAEDDCGGLVYGIEDVQDDWQIVRKMSESEDGVTTTAGACGDLEDALDDGSGEALFALDEDDTGMEEEEVENRRPGRACPNSWYLAPPPCFTRSAPSPCSTNPLENLLIEHPSMSVYLLPVAASSSAHRRASLYRSAPPLLLEEALSGRATPRTISPIRELQPATFRMAAAAAEPRHAEPASHRVTHAKRKRRVRAQRHAAGCSLRQQQQVATTQGAPPATAPTQNETPREIGIRTVVTEEEDKQTQNEDKELRAAKTLLTKGQLQRGNLLPEVTGPKKRANRDGNYRCLH